MPLVLEVIDAAGNVSKLPVEGRRLDVIAQPGAVYRIVDQNGGPIGVGPRVVRLDADLAIIDLPDGATIGITEFFTACSATNPCTLSLDELGGRSGETVTPVSEPIVALKEGGFLMNRPQGLAEEAPLASGSAFPWKPVAAGGAGLLVLGAIAGGVGGGGDQPDSTPPAPPSLAVEVSNNPRPVLTGTAEAGSRVSVTIAIGTTGQQVTYTATADANGQWSVDTANATPVVGTFPAGGLPTNVPSTVNLVATDAAGNVSTVASASLSFDVIPPVALATITGVSNNAAASPVAVANGSATNDPTPAINGRLSGPLGAGETVIVLRNGQAIGVATVTGTTWTFVDPGAAQGRSAYTAQVTDAAGNQSTASATYAVTIDTVAPVAPVITTPAAGLVVNSTVATGGLVVSGTGEAGTVVALTLGGTTRNLTVNAAGAWTTTFTAAQLPADGQASISAIAQDAAGNQSAASTRPVAIDLTPPVLTMAASAPAAGTGAFTVTFTFSEPVTGFTAADVAVTNGTAAATLTPLPGGQSYALVITPTAGSAAPVRVSVPAAAAADTAGNPTAAATLTQSVDTIAPTLTITDNATGVATGPVTFTFTFSEPVVGFTASNLNVTGGTAGPLVAAPGGTRYTMVVTPPADSTGTIVVTAPRDSARDAAGNSSVADRNSQPYNTDVAPTLVVTDGTAAASTNDQVIFTFTFSEPVTGFAAGDITVTGGTAGALTAAPGGAAYRLSVTPDANVQGGVIVVSVPAGAATDAAGSASPEGRGAQEYDTRAPVLAITDSIAEAEAPEGTQVTFTFEFDEPVSGFTADDVDVTGGTGVVFSEQTDGQVYTMVVIPEIGSTGVRVEVLANAAVDPSGNGHAAATETQAYVQPPPPAAIDGIELQYSIEALSDGSGYRLRVDSAAGPSDEGMLTSGTERAGAPATSAPVAAASALPQSPGPALLDDWLPTIQPAMI